jgi:hypothetical protein
MIFRGEKNFFFKYPFAATYIVVYWFIYRFYEMLKSPIIRTYTEHTNLSRLSIIVIIIDVTGFFECYKSGFTETRLYTVPGLIQLVKKCFVHKIIYSFKIDNNNIRAFNFISYLLISTKKKKKTFHLKLFTCYNVYLLQDLLMYMRNDPFKRVE